MELMKNYSQYENSEIVPKSIFLGFAKVLFIYAWFFTITQILNIFIPPIIQFSNISYILFTLFTIIGTIILLLLLVLNGHKINSNLHLNSKINLFYIGLIVWLIPYVLYFVLAFSSIFFNGFNIGNLAGRIITISIPVIASFSQFIAWISLFFFFRNPKGLISTNMGKNEYIFLMILAITSLLQILYLFIDMLLPINYLISLGLFGTFNQILTIFYYIIIILFILGYFMLSVSLMREKITLRGESNYHYKADISNTLNDTGNKNIIDDNNFSPRPKKFCKYCGHPIDPFMSFCPECGESLNS